MKRLGIFVFYDKMGVVDDYVLHLLSQMQGVLDNLVVVSNSRLSQEEKNKFLRFSSDYFERENIGFDGGAYKDAICSIVGWKKIRGYDELVLFNDTFYGFFCSANEVFDGMAARSCDFWGMTIHYENILKSIPEHVQSYFLVVRSNLLHDKSFEDFWSSFPYPTDFSQAVAQFECAFTRHFSSLGFSYGSYVNTDKWKKEFSGVGTNLQVHRNYRLLTELGCPVLKKKNVAVVSHDFSDDTMKCMQYIANNTDYDTNLIWQNLLRCNEISVMHKSFHFNMSLSSFQRAEGVPFKVTVLFFASDESCVSLLLNYIFKLKNFELYVITQTEEVFDRFKKIEATFNTKTKIVFLNGETKFFDAVSKDSDYYVFLNDNVDVSASPLVLDKIRLNKFDSLIRDQNYLENLLYSMRKNPIIGLVMPDNYSGLVLDENAEWKKYYKQVKEFLDLNGMTAPISENIVPFVHSNCFCARKEIANFIFDSVNTQQFDSLLPYALIYIVQSKGYLSFKARQSYQDVPIRIIQTCLPKEENMEEIYIYGAGKYGAQCYAQLIGQGRAVASFVVTDKTNNLDELFSVPVIDFSQFKNAKKTSSIIVAMKPSFQTEVVSLLKENGFDNIKFYPPLQNDMDTSRYVKMISLAQMCKKNKSSYIYGAGKYGRECLSYLKRFGITINGIIVTNNDSQVKKIDDVPVIELGDFHDDLESFIIVALKPKFRDDVLPLLKELGYNNSANLTDEKISTETMVREIGQPAWQRRHGFSIEPEAFYCLSEIHQKQRKWKFPCSIKFSILVPLYNTPQKVLKEMIASVLLQSYENWELCLADGSDFDHSYVQRICEDISKTDGRIKYRKLTENKGIAENTNSCADLAAGDYVALLDHDDLLHPAALYELMKVISNENADFIYTDEASFKSPNLYEIISTNFKPDFAPDYLNGFNYICHLTAFSRNLFDEVGHFNQEYERAQDYDLFFRLSEKAKCIRHVPKCLYYKRIIDQVNKNDGGAAVAGQKAVQAHLKRIGANAVVTSGFVSNTYRVKYEIENEPLVSIIIPNYEHWQTLKKCVESILNYSTYKNLEIIIVENNSESKETFNYYSELEKNPKIKVVKWPGKFNYPAINNFGAKNASGDYFILLNNDTEVITSNWIEEMLMYAQRTDVGAVGAMLYYPSNKIQHAGVVLGFGGYAAHTNNGVARNESGYANRLAVAQNLSCVTGACVMIPKKVFCSIGGFDENLEVAANDVDLCLRIREKGYNIVWTPFAELYHYESESRGYENSPEKQRRFESEKYYFSERWHSVLMVGDPYYNPNLTLDRGDFSLRGEDVVFHN